MVGIITGFVWERWRDSLPKVDNSEAMDGLPKAGRLGKLGKLGKTLENCFSLFRKGRQ